jgi:energy-coupling factor transport system substrate-specific component
MSAGRLADRARDTGVYVLIGVVGTAAFLWPFLLPADAAPATAHSADAPLVAAAVAGLVVAAIALEVRQGRMNGATVALLGVLAATGGLLRLFALPGGGNGIFFLIIIAGAAFGARFGLLLGILAMATSSVVTGGIGPWLPFQMLALGFMGAGAGALRPLLRRIPLPLAVGILCLYGWLWGFLYGGIMNLWFWPFIVDGGPLSYAPGLSVPEIARRYAAFYAVTSFGWDAAAALTNAVLIALTGGPLLRSMARFADRLDPVVEFVDVGPAAGHAGNPSARAVT